MKAQRLPGGSAFARVFEGGCSTAGKLLVLYVHPSDDERARVGFAVGKRLGGAVVRNRIRRRMREAFRLLPGSIGGADLVFVARGRILQASQGQIQREMRDLLLHTAKCAVDREGFFRVTVEFEEL
ncbi:MAG: ribonuclease P protein component [Bacillota bacterium]